MQSIEEVQALVDYGNQRRAANEKLLGALQVGGTFTQWHWGDAYSFIRLVHLLANMGIGASVAVIRLCWCPVAKKLPDKPTTLFTKFATSCSIRSFF